MNSPAFLPGCERRWWAFLEMSLYLFYICPSAVLNKVAVALVSLEHILECPAEMERLGSYWTQALSPTSLPSCRQFAASLSPEVVAAGGLSCPEPGEDTPIPPLRPKHRDKPLSQPVGPVSGMHPVLVPGLCVCFLPWALSLCSTALWLTPPHPPAWEPLAQNLGLTSSPVLEDNSFKD